VRSTGTPLEHTEEGRAFLQMRAGKFGLFGFLLSSSFIVLRMVEGLSLGTLDRILGEPSMLYHVLGSLSALSIWLACRGGSRSPGFVRTVEFVGLHLSCWFFALMGLDLPTHATPHFIVLLAIGLGLIARAIYIPSSGRRTVLLTGISGLPLLYVTWMIQRSVDVEAWKHVIPYLEEPGGLTSLAVLATSWTAAWWVAIVIICAGASRVIYGLRKEVRDARRLGQYTLVEKLGEGGMGMVYRATHAMLRRPTAIKLLPAEKAGERNVARFEREVQLTARLTHPNTVTIFDYGRTPDGVFYYAMELLDGASLAEVVEVLGAQPPARVVHVMAQAAGALAEAHAISLIHRDVKPANIMLVRQGGIPDVAKVLDFGLVKDLERAEDQSVTRTDAITGTPQYMAPEAITSPDKTDGRSDLYSLGAVGYYFLTGEHVFSGGSVVEVCSAHLHSVPTPPSQRLGKPVPADLEALILRCLAKDPADRPPSARQLQSALATCAGVGRWTESDASMWWEKNAPALGARRPKTESGTGLTVAIDLERRSPRD